MAASGWIQGKTVRITEHWRMIERKHLLGLFEDGSIHVISSDTLDDVTGKHSLFLRSDASDYRVSRSSWTV
jgi:hypothetical protein